jgi:hypothetical protein
MAGVLEDLFNVRTNGNGLIRSEWDDVLLKRDLERLVAGGQVKEVPRAVKEQSVWPDELEKKWLRDCETGETYEYTCAWEKSVPRFKKLSIDELGKAPPNPRPI